MDEPAEEPGVDLLGQGVAGVAGLGVFGWVCVCKSVCNLWLPSLIHPPKGPHHVHINQLTYLRCRQGHRHRLPPHGHQALTQPPGQKLLALPFPLSSRRRLGREQEEGRGAREGAGAAAGGGRRGDAGGGVLVVVVVLVVGGGSSGGGGGGGEFDLAQVEDAGECPQEEAAVLQQCGVGVLRWCGGVLRWF